MIEHNVLPFKLERCKEILTAHAGLIVAHEFHVGLGLDRLLDDHLPLPGSGRGHRASEVILPAVLMLQGGGTDLEGIGGIGRDKALCTAAQLQRVPASTTLGDWLRRCGASRWAMRGLQQVQRELTGTRLNAQKRSDFTLDIDATIIPADKADATKAYEGTRGYHPMLGFLFENRWLLADQFRTGSASPAGGLVEFIGHCRAQMPKGKRIARLRSDSAAYNHDMVDDCEQHGIEYAIGADWDSAVKELYRGLPHESWTRCVASGSRPEREVAETIHAFERGAGSFRIIFVRDVDPQKELFGEIRGRAIITNFSDEEMDAAAVVEWYNQRGTAENFIKEIKHGFGLHRVPCGQFHANAAWLRIAALAYNLFLLQQHLALPPDLARCSVSTVRWRLYQIAGRLVRHARQWVLKVAAELEAFADLQQMRTAARSAAFP